MNIAILQIYDDNIKSYAEYGRIINAMYANKHDYTYICFEYDLVPTSMSVYYNKIVALLSALQDRRKFDYVLYLDSDAFVTNFNYKIEDIINRHKEKDIIIASDENGSNNGVLLVKNSDTTKAFLQKSFSDRNFFHTENPEQSAMIYYLQGEYRNQTGVESCHILNAYLDGYLDFKNSGHKVRHWDEESFILHLFTLSNTDRCTILRQHLAKRNIICIPKPPDGPRFKQNYSPAQKNTPQN